MLNGFAKFFAYHATRRYFQFIAGQVGADRLVDGGLIAAAGVGRACGRRDGIAVEQDGDPGFAGSFQGRAILVS